MRKHILFFAFALAGIFMMACNPQKTTETAEAVELPESEITVYYFHNERRCATCEAVESETKAALEKYYPQQIKDGKIAFVSLSLEEASGASIADHFQIASQSLIVVKGDELKDITNEGFLYARATPVKLHQEVKKAIDPLIN